MPGPRMRKPRVRTLSLVALAAGTLGLSGCAAGYDAVTPAEACQNGAVFDCPRPAAVTGPPGRTYSTQRGMPLP